jgi:hypothetical protein
MVNIVPPLFIKGSARCAIRMNDQQDTSSVLRNPARPTSITRRCSASFGEKRSSAAGCRAAPFPFDPLKYLLHLPLDIYIKRHENRRFQLIGERLDKPLRAIVQVGHSQLGAQSSERFGATPGDRLIVSDPYDQAFSSLKGNARLWNYWNNL